MSNKAPNECGTFVKVRKLPAVILALTESLGMKHVITMRQLLNGKAFEELDLVIQSGGGDIHSAYQIIELLRLHSKRINGCVPFLAKSAATLLCLGCDKIFLTSSKWQQFKKPRYPKKHCKYKNNCKNTNHYFLSKVISVKPETPCLIGEMTFKSKVFSPLPLP